MTVFTANPTTTDQARLAALEAAVTQLTTTVGSNAGAASEAVSAVSADRDVGDQALQALVIAEAEAREDGLQAVSDRLAAEIVARAQGDEVVHDRLVSATLALGAALGEAVSVATWSELSAIATTNLQSGKAAKVYGPDAATHVDPVAGGSPVANEGVYSAVPGTGAGTGWKRVANLEVADIDAAVGGAQATLAAAVDVVSTAKELAIEAAGEADVTLLRPAGQSTRMVWGAAIDEDGYPGLWVGEDGKVRFAPADRQMADYLVVDVMTPRDAPFVVVDEDGYIGQSMSGTDPQGAAVASVAQTVDLMLRDAAFVIVDDDGYVGMSVADPRGSAAIARDFAVFASGSAPSRDVFLIDGARRARLTYSAAGDGDNYAPRASSSAVAWVSGAPGLEALKVERFPVAPAPVVEGITALHHIISSGQSLDIGVEADPQTLLPLNYGRALMFGGNGGYAPGFYAGSASPPESVMPDSELSALVDGRSVHAETIGPRFMNGLIETGPGDLAYLYSAHGSNGQPYSGLKKGGTGPNYRNMLRAMLRAQYFAWLSGLDYRVPAMTFIHGEADRADSKATYLAKILELRADLEGDMRAITGRGADVLRMFLCQTSGWCSYGLLTSAVPLAQLQCALDTPTLFTCIGPKYHLPYAAGAGVHILGAAQARWGEYYARAKARVDAGTGWSPMYPLSASRSGTSVTVSINVPQGALAIDTTLVTNPGNFGVSYKDGAGAQVAVSGVTIAGSSITFTIASAVAGTVQFGMLNPAGSTPVSAGPSSGARTCFRDSSTDVGADGQRLYNWMCHAEVAAA